jgi:membrane-associated phospholipid phosphatase
VAFLDDDIMRFVAAHRSPALTELAHAVHETGDSDPVLALLGLAALAVVVALKVWRVGAAVVLALVGASLATRALKSLVERPRPDGDLALLTVGGWAMPSGHATSTAALSVAVLVAAGWSASGERRAAALALAWGLVAANVVIAAFMIYLGAHWPTDVLAGWALGAALGFAAGRLLRRPVRA